MLDTLVAEDLIYKDFAHAKNQWFELAPIDYFLAKEVCQATFENLKGAGASGEVTLSQKHQLFHLVVLLSQSLRAGHSCLLLDEVAGQRFGFACDEQGYVSYHGFVFSEKKQLEQLLRAINIGPSTDALIVFTDARLYLRRYFHFERELMAALDDKLLMRVDVEKSLIKSSLKELFPEPELNELDWQQVAVANAMNKGFSVIAGGPGTGKTYTVTKLLAGLVMLKQQQNSRDNSASSKNSEHPLNIRLTAPTGKAAQRLSESISQAVTRFKGQIADDILDRIPKQACTLHRLLGVIPHSPNFRHHQDNKLSLDVLLIDEVSMVDLAMMTRVLRALPTHAKVILLGDADQLPSVATGSVLTDIAPRPHSGYSQENCQYLANALNSRLIKTYAVKGKARPLDYVTLLTKSRRFDGQGLIGRLANAVILGESVNSWQLLAEPSKNDIIANEKQPLLLDENIDSWLAKFVKQYYQPLFSFEHVEQAFKQLSTFSLLCATRKGDYGVENINQRVKDILVSRGYLANSDNLFHGQPIMISENDYAIGLYNGDIGLVWQHASGHLMAAFESDDGEVRWIMPSRLPPFETVFAMTIHKTQGSEFNHVAMILPAQQEHKLLSRELLYTAITRAKSLLSICCRENVWRTGVEAKVKRHSGLLIGKAH